MIAARTRQGKSRRRIRTWLAIVGFVAAAVATLVAVMLDSPLRCALPEHRAVGTSAALLAAVTFAWLTADAASRNAIAFAALGLLASVSMAPLNACRHAAPYSVFDLEVATAPGVRIAGECLIPRSPRPCPAVVIVPGSSGTAPVTRDSQFGIYRANADMFASDPVDVLEDINLPVPAVYGADDRVIPVKSAVQRMKRFAARDPRRGRTSLFDDCGHPLVRLRLPPQFPDGYANAMVDWASAESLP